MRNDIGPHFMKLFYTSNGHEHVSQFSVRDSVHGNEIDYTDSVHLKGGGNQTNQEAMDALVGKLINLMHVSSIFSRWERYNKPSINGNSVLVDSGVFENGGGQITGTLYPFSQAHFSFQGMGGNKFGFVLLETTYAPNQVILPGSLGGAGDIFEFVSYMTSYIGFVTTRGGDYLRVFQRLLTKTNDTLRKKYILQ